MGKRAGLKALLMAGVIVGSGADGALADAACSEDAVHLRGDWGQGRFSVEVADDPEERAQGLMNREDLSQWAGMLFVYPDPRQVGFWMKNTLIPLDMIFIDKTGTVARVHANAEPGDLTPIMGGSPDIKAVLEVNGGLAARVGIAPGTQIRHPAFAEHSAWPC